MSELRLPFPRTLLLGIASLTLVVATLGIGQTAHNQGEAKHLGFGYPLHCAYSDFTTYYTPPPSAQTYNLNPWEIPVEGNLLTFLASFLLTYAALLGSSLFTRKALRGLIRRLAGLPRPST